MPANLEQVALSATLVCIVALGEALVIIARQIDLSVGAIVAMSAFLAADWLEDQPGGSLAIVFLIGARRRRADGHRQRASGGGRPHPGDRRDARHARDLPRRRHRHAGGRQISATVLPDSYQASPRSMSCGVPLLVWLALLLTALVRLGGPLHAHRAQSLCARQQPGERAHRRHQRGPASGLCVHPLGRCCAVSSACCGARASAPSMP